MFKVMASAVDPSLEKMRARAFAGLNIEGLRGIEIGPLCRPLVTKDRSSVFYVDHCSTTELKTKYSNDSNVDLEKIVEVDFIWKDQPLVQTVGNICPVDYVVASHVIEHVPDLVGWLKEMHQSLREGGSLILIVPDKRFTFDVQRRVTSYEEVRAAYVERRRRPGLRCIMDHFANVVHADCFQLWQDHSISSDLSFCHSPAFLSLAAEQYAEGRYIDVHCWVFTPWSFLELMGRISVEEHLGFEIAYFDTTHVNDLEFYIRLIRVPESGTDWKLEASRAELSALWPMTR
jgi:SAM-dependent methyltransferase